VNEWVRKREWERERESLSEEKFYDFLLNDNWIQAMVAKPYNEFICRIKWVSESRERNTCYNLQWAQTGELQILKFLLSFLSLTIHFTYCENIVKIYVYKVYWAWAFFFSFNIPSLLIFINEFHIIHVVIKRYQYSHSIDI
jgi:hypothetical protein